ncbi:hypothetical protein QBC39DRAFT_266992 [Podospora conica]|nr:hypothetical protein QBC39DRAFT_266992 [Schizothecium conicum]
MNDLGTIVTGTGAPSGTDTDKPLSSVPEALSARGICVAFLIGTCICLANVYFGLQAGIVNAMPMQATLVGFAVFKFAAGTSTRKELTPIENTVIQAIAGALGRMYFTNGVTGLIPALEFLIPETIGPRISYPVSHLILWSLAVSFLGTVVAAPFGSSFILKQQLRFPSASATGTLNDML